MAVDTRRFFPLRQAKLRRLHLAHYLQFDSRRYLISIIILLSLMSLLTLGQTGIVATRGYAVAQLNSERLALQRHYDQLELRYAEASSLERIRTRAKQLGLRPATRDQMRYITINAPDATDTAPPAQPDSSDRPESPTR